MATKFSDPPRYGETIQIGVIEVTYRGSYQETSHNRVYHARIAGTRYWAAGHSVDDAIGDLYCTHTEVLAQAIRSQHQPNVVQVEYHIMGPEDRERYPECAKKEDGCTPSPTNHIIGAFMEWAESQGLKLCRLVPYTYEGYNTETCQYESRQSKTEKEWKQAKPPVGSGIEGWILSYLGLDPNTLDQEQRAMLAAMQQTKEEARDTTNH